MNTTLSQLSASLFVYQGAAQVGILRDGERAVLFDACEGVDLSALASLGIRTIERVYFTHHHRDSASGARALAAAGTHLWVPEAEAACFSDVDSYWSNPKSRWHLYYYHPHNLMLTESVPVTGVCRDGDVIQWGGATLSVISTPGHTNGSVSYQVDVDGIRVVFCGDTIYGDGQLWEAYSMQKGVGTMDYHGFMGARGELVPGLLRIKAADATMLVPSHGDVIREPSAAIDRLITRMESAYHRYAQISALRHYYPDVFKAYENAPGMMPMSTLVPQPPHVIHIETTWILVSESGAALVMDCGSPDIAKRIKALQDAGEIGPVEMLWISHYHDDHVDGVRRFRELFDCPVIADAEVKRVIENPLAWRLPCISPTQVILDRTTGDGERISWREFAITFFYLPGQTLYHGGLLAEGRGVRYFFAGDSFTPAGVDDYCTGNRNLLGSGRGVDYAMALVQRLNPDLIFNSHVEGGFPLSQETWAYMRANIVDRESVFGVLFPWDNPNYGLDEHWLRCFPYEQNVRPGEEVEVSVVFMNHSNHDVLASCRPVLPHTWNQFVESRSATCKAWVETVIAFRFRIPASAQECRTVMAFDITYDGRYLGHAREAIFVVKP